MTVIRKVHNRKINSSGKNKPSADTGNCFKFEVLIMRNSPFWWVLIGLMITVDIYVFQVLKAVTQSLSPRTRSIIIVAYWIFSAGAVVLLLLLPYLKFESLSRVMRSSVFAVILGLFFAKLVASLFFLMDDIRRGIQWVAARFLQSPPAGETFAGEPITRSAFLNWTGLLMGGTLFGSLLYGFGNKYRYQVKRVKLSFANLPAAFRGLKVIHISDIHSGSFNDREAVQRGVQKIMEEKPDLVLFTGDLVNNKAEEMDQYKEVFAAVKAPLGVYSTLGNHDYGDYVKWGDEDESGQSLLKKQNLEALKQVHRDIGWNLLLDEHREIERAGEKIALIGVQNISGKSNFHSYGNLAKASKGTEAHPFRILMSHDPSHWNAEVTSKYPQIDLMLSGHTHGFQFGVDIPGLRWSPVQYVYKQWAGLYEAGQQKLYVNPGFGFIGYPGRVGILPEITVLEFV
jgi:uncharacterized protein